MKFELNRPLEMKMGSESVDKYIKVEKKPSFERVTQTEWIRISGSENCVHKS